MSSGTKYLRRKPNPFSASLFAAETLVLQTSLRFITSVAVITPDPSVSGGLCVDALALPLTTEGHGYLHSDNIDRYPGPIGRGADVGSGHRKHAGEFDNVRTGDVDPWRAASNTASAPRR